MMTNVYFCGECFSPGFTRKIVKWEEFDAFGNPVSSDELENVVSCPTCGSSEIITVQIPDDLRVNDQELLVHLIMLSALAEAKSLSIPPNVKKRYAELVTRSNVTFKRKKTFKELVCLTCGSINVAQINKKLTFCRSCLSRRIAEVEFDERLLSFLSELRASKVLKILPLAEKLNLVEVKASTKKVKRFPFLRRS